MKLLTRSCLALLGGLGIVGSASADIVHNDDVIITFSQCVGNDCVNGENFGADTVRLKENNLRIHFNDTSNSASFPTNDWRIVANDSTNGGANYLAIEDSSAGRIPFRVEAGAPANALVVEADGDIGVKTLNPVVDIHIVEGNTPTVRLEQDGSDGFTPQTWDLAGNEANFFIRDVTNGSKLFFRSEPGAPENSIYIDSSGDVGYGTSSPQQDIHISDTSSIAGTNPGFRIQDDNESWDVYVQTDSSRFNIRNNTTSNVPFKIDETANNNLLLLGTNTDSSEIVMTGKLLLNGTEVTPDYVFASDYKLESIEEHAAFMWSNKHLPAVLPATVNEDGLHVIQVGARTQGMLEELEKAHIYIEQLHQNLTKLEAEKLSLRKNLEEMHLSFEERIKRLESAAVK